MSGLTGDRSVSDGTVPYSAGSVGGAEVHRQSGNGRPRGDGVTLCVWLRSQVVTRRGMWAMAGAVNSADAGLKSAVLEVQRVRQRDGVCRFDVVVDRARSDAVTALWTTVGRQRYKWVVRPYVQFWRRPHARGLAADRVVRPVAAVDGPAALGEAVVVSFATINVNSLRYKKAMVETYIRSRGLGIVALQETVRGVGSFQLRLAGYQCIERLAVQESGARGVALCVDRRWSVAEVGPVSCHFIFGRVTGLPGAGGRGLIVGCVYVPPGSRGTGVKRELHAAVCCIRRRFPSDSLLVMGDYNMSESGTVKWASRRYATGVSSGLALQRGSGNMRSRHVVHTTHTVVNGVSSKLRTVVAHRAIDHVLVSVDDAALVGGVVVDRRFVDSDHWAVVGRVHTLHLRGDGGGEPLAAIEPVMRFIQARPSRVPATVVTPSLAVRVRDDVRWSDPTLNPYAVLHDMGSDVASDDDVSAEHVAVLESERLLYAVSSAAAAVLQVSHGVGKSNGVYKPVVQQRGERLWHDRRCVRVAVASRAGAFLVWKRVSSGVSLASAQQGSGVRDARSNAGVSDVTTVTSSDGALSGAVVLNAAECTEAWERYREASRAVKSLTRRLSTESWVLWVTRGASRLASDPAGYWRWQKTLSGRGRRGPSGSAAMLDPEDSSVLITDTEQLGEAWARHFELGRAPIRTTEYWDSLRHESVDGSRDDGIPEVNTPLTWAEVQQSLMSLKSNKAPGPDGVPAWWLQLAVDPRSNPPTPVGAVPLTQMGKCLFTLLSFVWEHGVLPKEWNLATVVPILKKGDSLDMGNYRPISLMFVVLKVLCGVARSRFVPVVAPLVPKAQAGFRMGEECVAQAVVLHEFVRRRRATGEATIVTVFDVAKAFDTVPHGALLMKLARFGFSGRWLAFITALYECPVMSVRAGSIMSRVVDIVAGVRQGDLISPDLFNFFQFDLSAKLKELLVECSAPGLRGMDLCELFVADDLVTIACSIEDAQAQCRAVECWLEQYDMRANAKKGVLMVVASTEAVRLTAVAVLEAADIRMHGVAVPIGRQVTYLGLQFDDSWDLGEMGRARASKGQSMIDANASYFSCQSIPLFHRIHVLKTCVVSSMTYGCQVWGSVATASMCQTVVNRALRLCIGCASGSTTVSTAVLCRETGMQSMRALCDAGRVRLFTKAPTMQTLINTVIELPFGYGFNARCKAIVTRYGVPMSTVRRENDAQPHPCPKAAYRAVAEAVDGYLWEPGNHWCKSASAQRYKHHGYSEHALCLSSSPWPVVDGQAMALLVRARCGAIWTADRAVCAGLPWARVAVNADGECPFCRRHRQHDSPSDVVDAQGDDGDSSDDRVSAVSLGVVAGAGSEVGRDAPAPRETLCHLWTECSAWDSLREQYLGQMLAQMEVLAGVQQIPLTNEGKQIMLQGGSFEGMVLPDWDSTVEDSGSDSDGGSQAQGSRGSYVSIGQPRDCVQAARFLKAVMELRARRIKSWTQMAALAADGVH